jgi:hypothetical protein
MKKQGLWSVLMVLLTVFVLSACAGKTPKENLGEGKYQLAYTHYLRHFNQKTDVEGKYFLAIKQVGSEMYYVFIEVQEDGSSYVQQVDIGSAVYRVDIVDESPYVKRYDCVVDPDSSSYINYCLRTSKMPEAVGWAGPRVWYEFHIPPGSIGEMRDLGLQ